MMNSFMQVRVNGTRRAAAHTPAGSALFVGRNDDHLDRHRGPQQVDHLLVGQRHGGHLADLHQPAALPQSGLPGEAVLLHLQQQEARFPMKYAYKHRDG